MMSKKVDKLIEQVCSDPYSSRELVVGCLKAIAEDAKKYTLSELTKTRTPESPADTTGEKIGITIAHVILMQDWIDYETADDLCEIEEIAAGIELDAKHEAAWKELFEKIDNLKP